MRSAPSLEPWADAARQALRAALDWAGGPARGDVFVEELHRTSRRRSGGLALPAAHRSGRGAALRFWQGAGGAFASFDGAPAVALRGALEQIGVPRSASGSLPGPSAGSPLERIRASRVRPGEAARSAPVTPQTTDADRYLEALDASLTRRLGGLPPALEIETAERQTLVATDAGELHLSSWSWTRLSILCRNDKGARVRWSGGAAGLAELRKRHPLTGLARVLRRRLTGALHDGTLPECDPATPIVFSAGNGGLILHEFAHQLEADRIAGDWSPWKDGDEDQRELSPLLNMWDDPSRPHLRGSYRTDDEGQAGERRLLVRRGQVGGRLGDRRRQESRPGVRAGHGRRASWREPPSPRAGNICLAGGDHDVDGVLQEKGPMLVVHDLEEGGTDPRTGDFTVRVSDGEWLDGGRVLGPVAGIDLEGNVIDLLASVDRVCDDRRPDNGATTCRRDGSGVPIGFHTPSFRARGLGAVEVR